LQEKPREQRHKCQKKASFEEVDWIIVRLNPIRANSNEVLMMHVNLKTRRIAFILIFFRNTLLVFVR
jgi:hypothetical protein